MPRIVVWTSGTAAIVCGLLLWSTWGDGASSQDVERGSDGGRLDVQPELEGRAAEVRAARGPREPAHVESLLAALTSSDAEARHQALRAIEQQNAMDPLPIDVLIRMALTPDGGRIDSDASSWALREIGKRTGEARSHVRSILQQVLESDSGPVRAMAANLVATIGAVSAADVPLLVEVYDSPRSGYVVKRALIEVVEALGSDGLPVAPALIAFVKQILDDRDEEQERMMREGIHATWDLVEYRVAGAIAAMGSGVVPLVLEAIRSELALRAGDERTYRMWNPISAYGRVLAELQAESIPALLDLIVDPDPRVRAIAVSAFEDGGVRDPRVRDALIVAVADAEADVREAAAEALRHQDAEAIPALVRALADRDKNVRKEAANSLRRLGADPADTLEPLLRALAEADRFEAPSIARSIVSMGATAASALPALCAIFEHRPDDDWFAAMVADEIARLAPHDMGALLRAFDAGGVGIRRGVVRVLAQLETLDADATRTLDAALASDDVVVRTQAAAVLARLGRADVFAVLSSGIDSASTSVRAAALRGVAYAGADGLSLLPRLIERLPDAERRALGQADDERYLMSHAIARIGRHDLTRMLALLDSDDFDLQSAAEVAFVSAGVEGLEFLESVWPTADEPIRRAIIDHASIYVLHSKKREPDEVAAGRRIALVALGDSSPEIRLTAARGLRQDAALGLRVLETLVALLDAETGVAASAAYELQTYGPRAAPVRAALEARRDHPDETVREYLRRTLERIEDGR